MNGEALTPDRRRQAARREAGPDSDLDFVVELDEKTFDRYVPTW